MQVGNPKSPPGKCRRIRENSGFPCKEFSNAKQKADPENSRKLILGIPNGHFGMTFCLPNANCQSCFWARVPRGNDSPCPSFPLFILEFLAFFPPRGIPCFCDRFSLLFHEFYRFGRDKKSLVFLVVFLAFVSKKEKEITAPGLVKKRDRCRVIFLFCFCIFNQNFC